jgi:hypothetical protein
MTDQEKRQALFLRLSPEVRISQEPDQLLIKLFGNASRQITRASFGKFSGVFPAYGRSVDAVCAEVRLWHAIFVHEGLAPGVPFYLLDFALYCEIRALINSASPRSAP